MTYGATMQVDRSIVFPNLHCKIEHLNSKARNGVRTHVIGAYFV